MGGWDGSGSVHALRLRVRRLDASGAPVVGASSMYTTSTLVDISSTPTYEDGDEITQKNGSGELCLNYKEPDVLTGGEMKMTICTPDPELLELLLGGSVITGGGNSIGYAAPRVGAVGTPNGVSIEAWSRLVLNGSATGQYLRWLWPKVIWRADEKKLEAGAFSPGLTGVAYENPSWTATDWTWSSTSWEQFVKTGTLPNSNLGYQPIAA